MSGIEQNRRGVPMSDGGRIVASMTPREMSEAALHMRGYDVRYERHDIRISHLGGRCSVLDGFWAVARSRFDGREFRSAGSMDKTHEVRQLASELVFR